MRRKGSQVVKQSDNLTSNSRYRTRNTYIYNNGCLTILGAGAGAKWGKKIGPNSTTAG